MARMRLPNQTFQGANIRFKNFSGTEGPMNAKGDRNFSVFLDPETATAMIEDGWNIKQLKPREDGDIPQDYLKVKLNMETVPGQRPPQIKLITSTGQTSITEDMLNMLDWAQISNWDIIISPYYWEMNGKKGITAYCQSLYATLIEDELELKYANVPDSSRGSLPETPAFPTEEEYHG